MSNEQVTPYNSSINHSATSEECQHLIPKEDGAFFTGEQIIEYMVKNMKGEDLVTILGIESEAKMIVFHMSVGRWMRNTFKLWEAAYPHADGMHPDDFSYELLKGIWRAVHLREKIGM